MTRPTLDDIVPQRPLNNQPDWIGGARRKRSNARTIKAAAIVGALALAIPGLGVAVNALTDPTAVPVPAAPVTSTTAPAPSTPAPTPTETPDGLVPIEQDPCGPTQNTTSIDPSTIVDGVICGTSLSDGEMVATKLPSDLVAMLREELPLESVRADFKPFELRAPSIRLTMPEGVFTLIPVSADGGNRAYAWQADDGWRYWHPTIPFDEAFAPLTENMRHKFDDPAADACTTAADPFNGYDPATVTHVVWCERTGSTIETNMLPDEVGKSFVEVFTEEATLVGEVPETAGGYLAAMDAEGRVGQMWLTADGSFAEVFVDASSNVWEPRGAVAEVLTRLGILPN